MANETPSRPPPFMANAILNFHFDYLHTSLIEKLKIVLWTYLTARWFRFVLLIPPVIRMVTLYYVVILSFLNHLHLNNGSDKTGSVVHW